MSLTPLFFILQAFEDCVADVSASYFEFWGACMEALSNADLRDL